MATPKPTCDRCAGVIGVYEPIVAVFDGRARETSRVVEPEIGSHHSELFHRACYEERFGKAPVRDRRSLTGAS